MKTKSNMTVKESRTYGDVALDIIMEMGYPNNTNLMEQVDTVKEKMGIVNDLAAIQLVLKCADLYKLKLLKQNDKR